METTFDDYYIILIGVGLVVLCFFRTITQHLFECLVEVENAISTRCCSFCCGVEEKPMYYVLRCLIISYGFFQPMVFGIAHLAHHAQHGKGLFVLVSLYSNDDVWKGVNVFNASIGASLDSIDVSASVVRLDVIYVVLPLAFAMSVNTMTWVSLTSNGELAFDQPWDENLPDSVSAYEVTYIIECWMLNSAYVFIYCSGERPIVLLLAGFFFTTVMGFFIINARCTEKNWEMGFFAMILLSAFFCGSSAFLSACLQWHVDSVSVMACVHIVYIVATLSIHMIASGQATASFIIFSRVCLAELASAALLVFYIET